MMNSNRYHVIGLRVRLCLLLFTGSFMMSKVIYDIIYDDKAYVLGLCGFHCLFVCFFVSCFSFLSFLVTPLSPVLISISLLFKVSLHELCQRHLGAC